ncbi:unnamed protein product [Arctogadus glacialis]
MSEEEFLLSLSAPQNTSHTSGSGQLRGGAEGEELRGSESPLAVGAGSSSPEAATCFPAPPHCLHLSHCSIFLSVASPPPRSPSFVPRELPLVVEVLG